MAESYILIGGLVAMETKNIMELKFGTVSHYQLLVR